MKIELDAEKLHLNQRTVLAYLGYRGQDLAAISPLIDKGIEDIKKNAEIKYICDEQKISVKEEDIILGNGLILKGNSIKKHLNACNTAVIIIATIGFKIDKLIYAAQEKTPTAAMILDGAGSAMIEEVMDSISGILKEKYKNTTGRFSPGYGDLPLSTNAHMMKIYNTDRNLGIFINEHFLMSPSKSVTAIVGIRE